MLRKFYRTYIHSPWLDTAIYAVLDRVTNFYARLKRFSFPHNYIRRWKLDMLGGLYERETYELFKKILKPGMTVIDIGAHIGYFTRLFSECTGRSGKVYAFEPDPENFALLQKNTKHLKNTILLNLAVTDKKKTTDFYRSEKTGCHSLAPNDTRKREVISVESTTLDTEFSSRKVEKIDIIKIDIEGGEIPALHGARHLLSINPSLALVVEWNPSCLEQAGFSPLALFQDLHGLGFRIFAIQSDNLLRIEADSFKNSADLLNGSGFVNLFCTK